MHHIYCISGLGADQRIFQKLRIKNAELHFITWEKPQASDDMRSYALKLAQQIKHDNIILMGVSFGGMLASEILNQQLANKGTNDALPFHIEKTILVSSCKCRQEFPTPMKITGSLHLHKAVPYSFILRNSRLNRLVFDLRSKEEELYLKRKMLQDNDLEAIKKSIDIIMTWKGKQPPLNNLVHIHGAKDRLLSPQNVKADYWISDGGHFMVWNKAEEVSGIINGVLGEGQ